MLYGQNAALTMLNGRNGASGPGGIYHISYMIILYKFIMIYVQLND